MMRFLKQLHKWVGLLIGIQVLLWLVSGLVISLSDPAKVSGKKWSSPASSSEPRQYQEILELGELPTKLTSNALRIDLKVSPTGPVYEIVRPGGAILLDAINGLPIIFQEQDAHGIASRDFTGDGKILSVESGEAPNLETRDHSGPYWRVNFSDTPNTSYYISQASGEILERRNSYWRTRDFFWMLHIMDYSGREDFNNALVIIIALIAVWLGISGFLLLFYSFNRHDFWFLNVTGKHDEATITLIDPSQARPQKVKLRIGSNLFLALAHHDINLPSICGGGGECGKCKIRYDSADLPGPNSIEQGLIPRRQRERGVRLACQQEVTTNITLQLTPGSLAPGSGPTDSLV
jgi:ferredoxin